MENEQKNNEPKQLSYEELAQMCATLQGEVDGYRRINEIREMVAICIELLKYKDALPKATFDKVVAFIDKIIPVAKDKE